VVDPALTYSVPPDVTATSGLDALTQLIEPFTCNSPNPLPDALCREGLRRAGRALRQAYENGGDATAREDMALAALLSGMALANARLGAVHGLAGPLGGMFPAPHGALCARLLPYTMDANVRALQTRAPEAQALVRYAEVAQLLTGDPRATATDGVAWVRALCADLAIPPLARYGVTEADVPKVVPLAQKANSMKGNPIALRDEEVVEILAQAL
jgi:alcohol dehydrogenase class IV